MSISGIVVCNSKPYAVGNINSDAIKIDLDIANFGYNNIDFNNFDLGSIDINIGMNYTSTQASSAKTDNFNFEDLDMPKEAELVFLEPCKHAKKLT